MTAQGATRGQWPISEKCITRFAPSPTGRLHLGHATSAVAAHDLARRGGGQFLLRIEDIDTGRARPEFVEGIFQDLRWLGLDWDGEVWTQSTRDAAYRTALEILMARRLVYRCICTRTEIAASASAPHGDAVLPYPGTCRWAAVAPDDPRPACWRIDMAAALAATGPLQWEDAGAGTVNADPGGFGDVVIARKDALASYHLAVTVDDAAQQVTDIVRGSDLFGATHIHRLLQALLGLPVPRYRHHPLVLGPDGKRLAKRTLGATLADMRATGLDGPTLATMLRNRELPLGFAFHSP